MIIIRDILSQTRATLSANKLRSFLTMFGVGWGVMSIVLMTAIGEGFRVAQRRNMLNLGKDIMIIWGGRTSIQAAGYQAGRAIRLEYSDYEAIRDRCRLIRHVSPELIRSDLVAKSQINNGTFSVHGILPEYQQMRTIEIRWGRPLNWADDEERRAVCIIGPEVNDQLFNGADSSGETLTLDGHPFTIVGVMPEKFQNSNYSGQDKRKIFIPYHTMVKHFSNPQLGQSRELVNNIIAMPVDARRHREAELEVRTVLGEKRSFHPQDEDALSIWNTAQNAQMVDAILSSMQWFLGAVGVVTLMLGGVGVINIMLITVRERTVEIGVRRSVGARRRDILWQFFSESLALTLFSGTSGLLIGWGICNAVNRLPLPQEVFAGMIITPAVGIGAFGLLFSIGIAAALYPAHAASELNPIEALRYENQ